MTDLRIGHLYPDLMSIYGDRGNVLALTQRARWRGIDVETRAFTAGETWDPDWADVYFFGVALTSFDWAPVPLRLSAATS